MATIINNTAYLLSTASQQAIRNALGELGIDEVEAKFAYTNDDEAVFDIQDAEGNYLFSIDTSNDLIFDK